MKLLSLRTPAVLLAAVSLAFGTMAPAAHAATPTLTVTSNIPDGPGECQQWTTNAPYDQKVTWSIDGVVTNVGQLSYYSLCPDWSWYNITTTAKYLELTLWDPSATVQVGDTLSTYAGNVTLLATAGAYYYPAGTDTSGGTTPPPPTSTSPTFTPEDRFTVAPKDRDRKSYSATPPGLLKK